MYTGFFCQIIFNLNICKKNCLNKKKLDFEGQKLELSKKN